MVLKLYRNIIVPCMCIGLYKCIIDNYNFSVSIKEKIIKRDISTEKELDNFWKIVSTVIV